MLPNQLPCHSHLPTFYSIPFPGRFASLRLRGGSSQTPTPFSANSAAVPLSQNAENPAVDSYAASSAAEDEYEEPVGDNIVKADQILFEEPSPDAAANQRFTAPVTVPFIAPVTAPFVAPAFTSMT